MDLPIVISSEEYAINFNHFNQIQNRYELKCVDRNKKYPKSLLKAAWKWFLEFAEEMHIDASFYKWVEIVQSDGVTWQIDFHDTPERMFRCISLYEIYFDGKSRSIMQAGWSIG